MAQISGPSFEVKKSTDIDIPAKETGSTGVATLKGDPEQVHTIDPKQTGGKSTTFFGQTSEPGMNGKDIVMKGSLKKGSAHYYDYEHSSKIEVPLFEESSTGIKTKLAEPE